LFVQSTTELGGAEKVLLNLFTASDELRRRRLIATLGFGSGDLPSRLRAVGAEVMEFEMPRLRQMWNRMRSAAGCCAAACRISTKLG
jgi:hypothetical protein